MKTLNLKNALVVLMLLIAQSLHAQDKCKLERMDTDEFIGYNFLQTPLYFGLLADLITLPTTHRVPDCTL